MQTDFAPKSRRKIPPSLKKNRDFHGDGGLSSQNRNATRYLDPKYSRWMSTDPALQDYIPLVPTDDEAKRHNENLPGMVGVYNLANLNLYHYSAQNPVKYVDPDGNDIHTVNLLGAGVKLIVGADVSLGVSWDDNGNVAVSISVGVGVGVEGSVDLPISPSYSVSEGVNINELPGIGVFRVTGDADGGGLETSVGVIGGVTIDHKGKKAAGGNIGTIGGGVTFASGTLHMVVKHGIKDLQKKLDSIDSGISEHFMSELKNNENIPDEVKQKFLDE